VIGIIVTVELDDVASLVECDGLAALASTTPAEAWAMHTSGDEGGTARRGTRAGRRLRRGCFGAEEDLRGRDRRRAALRDGYRRRFDVRWLGWGDSERALGDGLLPQQHLKGLALLPLALQGERAGVLSLGEFVH
jgi:hypothetical protein